MATLQSIQARIAKLQAQAETLVTKKSTVVLDKIRELMQKNGIVVADIEAHVAQRRGRKPQASAAAKQGASAAQYVDPKTGATWSGRGRAPSWIANAKDRSKFLADSAAPKATETAKKAPKAGSYVRGPQAPKYKDPKTGATWSGRGPAPAWLAAAKDRSKFLIAEAAAPVSTAKVKTESAAPIKKTATKPVAKKAAKQAPTVEKTPAKSAAAKKAAAKNAVSQERASTAARADATKATVKRAPTKRVSVKRTVKKPTARVETSVVDSTATPVAAPAAAVDAVAATA